MYLVRLWKNLLDLLCVVCKGFSINICSPIVAQSELALWRSPPQYAVTGGMEREQFTSYPQRWVPHIFIIFIKWMLMCLHQAVMACLMMLNMAGYMMSVSFGPVAPQAAQYYSVSGSMIDLFPLVALGINMPAMFSAIYCIDRLVGSNLFWVGW